MAGEARVRGRRTVLVLAGGIGLVAAVAGLVYSAPRWQDRAPAERASSAAGAHPDAAAATSSAPTGSRRSTRPGAQEPATAGVASVAADGSDHSSDLARLRESGEKIDALRADARKQRDALAALRRDKNADPAERERLEKEFAEAEARLEEQEKARRVARSEYKRWLAADASRPAALYDSMAMSGGPAERQEAGRILASFFGNSALESRVARDLTGASDEGVRGMALDIALARPTDRRLDGIRAMARKDASGELRARAVEVLGRFQEDPLVIRRRGEVRLTLLDAARSGATPAERRGALLALGRTDNPEPDLRALAEHMAKEDPDVGVRAIAQHVMNNWNAPETNRREGS